MVVSFMCAASHENEPKRRKLNSDSPHSFSSDLQKHAFAEIPAIDAKASRKNQVGASASNHEGLDLNSNQVDGEIEIRRPNYGVVSIQGRRGEMEDAVAVHPSFCNSQKPAHQEFHYLAVFDGHGCSHAAMECRDRMHELIKEELEETSDSNAEFEDAMARSFNRMDKEVTSLPKHEQEHPLRGSNCRCGLRFPECDAVGSTALVSIITPHKVIVSNCGDSRAVLCRNGNPVPLSCDHKPDRPDEQRRIEELGGKVILWDAARVLGVLSMSRAIGDNYLKPYVSCAAEVEITERKENDECLIMGTDGLWDVVPNDMACRVARGCLGDDSEKGCLNAARLLTKMALARRSSDNISVVVVDLRRRT